MSLDARKRLAESITRLDQRDFHREWLRAMDETYPPTEPRDQERDMTSPTQRRHDELVALLTEIRDRLPEPVERESLIQRNLDAFKHEAETPMCEHGECCEPAPADDGLAEWERELFRPATCCGKCPPIVGGGYDCTCEGNPRCEKSAPADDLPGEPVEPGDLRAGDRVGLSWLGTSQRFICTLVSYQDLDVLRSDVPCLGDSTLNVVYRGREWGWGISDVRLIERAPREDDDPDEALASSIEYRLETTHSWLEAARAAREHIYAEPDQSWVTRDIEEAEGYYRVERARAEKSEEILRKVREVLDNG